MADRGLRVEGLTTAAGGPYSLEVHPRTCVTVMGPSGVGKSLLLRALADLDPHGGEVWLGEVRQSACPAESWRRQVAYLPAAAGWWAESVAEHFADFAAACPDVSALGLDPVCGAWPVARLSSGERQRLSLLRAFEARPPVLLLDEPTANLDAATTLAVERWLLARKEDGAALLWVTHDAAQAQRVADRQLVLDVNGVREAGHG